MESENRNSQISEEQANSGSESQWYTVQVMSGQENKVVTSLKVRSEKNQAMGIDSGLDDILMPTVKVVERKDGKNYIREQKCYPGYVFVKARIYNSQGKIIPDQWQFIKDTKGVINFMGGEKPIPLTNDEIEKLTTIEEEKDKPKMEHTWNVGDMVAVKEGAFQGFEGVIESVDEEKRRLKVSVQIFGRSVLCDADFWQVDVPEEPRN